MDKQPMTSIKRFLIFAGDYNEKIGGVKNLKASVDTIQELEILALERGFNWINILDCETGLFLGLSGEGVLVSDFARFYEGDKIHGPATENIDRGRIQDSSWH